MLNCDWRCPRSCFALVAGDWDAVRNYKVTGSNSYSKMVASYRQDLLARIALTFPSREIRKR